ncbi:MAG: orotate phosphoribosyltransferase [Chitinophagaceae bacterium]
MTNEKAITEKLLQIGAIKLQPTAPFTWASGWKSPIYCDNRRALSFPYIRDFIKSELSNVIFENYPNAALLAGVATAGIAWGALAADQLKLPYIYVRPKPKEHGLGNQIEGYYQEGQEVIIIEDLISTGKSSLQVAEVLQKAGLNVVAMVSIFSYQFPVAQQAFEQSNIPFISLSNYNALLEVAVSKNIIKEDTMQLLQNWRNNPAEWQGI